MVNYPQLSDLSVLVVEDVYLVAEEITDRLKDWGCKVVGPSARVEEAIEEVGRARLDGALLDVNLDGEMSFPIADELSVRGIPFIFLTGYDMESAFPARYRDRPRLSKPVNGARLSRVMAETFHPPVQEPSGASTG